VAAFLAVAGMVAAVACAYCTRTPTSEANDITRASFGKGLGPIVGNQVE
jgi:hypothetical protein